MPLDWTDYYTAWWDELHLALGRRKNPNGWYFHRWWNQKVRSLEKGVHFWHYSVSHNFIGKVSKAARNDGQKPNERNLGRECYSFSERENRAFVIALREAESLAQKLWVRLHAETDAIGNLYIRVAWSREQNEEDFETHMIGSHLDSVENGGKYDGVAGIAAGLETLQQVLYHAKQGTLVNSFCLTVFRSEESGPHNGVACLGSSIATGTITQEKLENIVYKRENGKDVLLKDYLESSLRRYFQASQSINDLNNVRLSWWEEEEYIDHEWWYWFCQQHNIVGEDYSTWEWWQKICDSLVFPKITKDNTTSYREIHIEQGKNISSAGVDLGIVSWGIGGAKRYKTMQEIPVETREVSWDQYELYSFSIKWFSDHTGSTPNNPSLESSEYRRDAQIATNLFLRAFLAHDFWELVSSKAENDEWYTKVPFQQRIHLAISKDKKADFTQFIREQRKLLREENNIDFTRGRYAPLRDDTQVIKQSSAKTHIDVLLWVAESASEEFVKQREWNPEEKQFWTTRATLTNVHLTPEGLKFYLDIREVDTDDVQQLIERMSENLQKNLPEWIDWLQLVSGKVHEKVDKTMRDQAKAVAEILWYTTIFLPSHPWHDLDRVAATGVPSSMIFIRQEDGVSHNPAEKMQTIHYNCATHVLMKSLLADVV